MSIYVGTNEIKNVYVGTTPVKWIYCWTTKVRPSGWQPWANTLIYCPLTSDYTDHSWNSNTINIKHTPTLTTYWGVACAYLDQLVCLYTDILSLTTYTMSVWVNHQWGKWREWVILVQWKNTWVWSGVRWWLYQSKFTASIVNVGYSTQYTVNYTWWHLVTFTRNGNNFKMYWDGVYKGTYNDTYTSDYRFWINDFYNFDNANHQWKWYYSNWIVENKVRTDTEISDYYNLTKSTYGL